MYVHIGKELIIPENEIITILDLEKMLENKNLEDVAFAAEQILNDILKLDKEGV